MITRYLRHDDGTPWATLVSFGPKHVAASVCSPKDQFSKRDGRWLAVRRALAGARYPRLFDAEREQRVMEALIEFSSWAHHMEERKPGFFEADEREIENISAFVAKLSRREKNVVLNGLATAILDELAIETEEVYA